MTPRTRTSLLCLTLLVATPAAGARPQDDPAPKVIGIGGPTDGPYRERLKAQRGPEAGGPEVRRAVERALAWLVAEQGEDGSWEVGNVPAERSAIHAEGVTGLALLALLGDGSTMTQGPHKEAVQRAVSWLLSRQDPDSGRIGDTKGHTYQYEHAIATVALCEAYHFSKSPLLRAKVTKAVRYVMTSRNPGAAWRYDVPPVGDNDTSVTGWMLLALDTAHLAGLITEEERTQVGGEALAWIDTMTDTSTGRVGYDSRGSNSSRILGVNDRFPTDGAEAMTGVGLYVGHRYGHGDAARREQQAERLLKQLPEWDADGLGCDMYAWFFGTYALRWQGGTAWERWRTALQEVLPEHQVKDREQRGSFEPIGPWGQVGGRVYATALMALCLESPYREMPPAR